MKQRLLIAGALVVVLASVAVAGLAWSAMSRAEVASARALAANQQMLARLNEMAEALKHPRSLDWNPVKAVVVDGTPDGPPVKGVDITLSSDAPGSESRGNTDARGMADLGSHKPGD